MISVTDGSAKITELTFGRRARPPSMCTVPGGTAGKRSLRGGPGSSIFSERDSDVPSKVAVSSSWESEMSSSISLHTSGSSSGYLS